ncbi:MULTISPECIES: hypothetical protein [unclassified Caulobacter]|nr:MULTISPECIES: hypothetical protein [unclassified Caulobacter]
MSSVRKIARIIRPA